MKKIIIFLTLVVILGACGATQSATLAASVDPAVVAPVGPTPTLRVVMLASPLEDVVIVAGRPQIFEFFAYW